MNKQYEDGDPCPFCKKGILHPSGLRWDVEKPKIESGEARRERTKFVCDTCGKDPSNFKLVLKDKI